VSHVETSRAEEPSADVKSARSAGRGVLSITGAKVYFIITGYAVQLLLPRFLGSPEAFGLFSSAMNVVSILNNVLIAATVQSVSKHVSEDLAHADGSLRQGLYLQTLVGSVLGLGLFALAPWLARSVLLDALLEPMIRISAIVVFSYAVYAALVGSLNGRQRFAQQAKLDVTYTTLRSLGMLGAAALGFGALGALAGFAGAALTILVIALLMVGTGTAGQPIAWRRWLLFLAPLWLYQLCLQGALQVDLSVLKGSAAALGQEVGMTPAAAAEAASRMAGFYRAAQTFAFVPYQLILSVTFVVFPMMSQAVAAGDLDASRRYIHGGMRFSLLVLLAIAAPISGAAGGIMRIAYPNAYLAGSDALAVLALGMVCFSLFTIGSTVLSGAGRPGLPALIAAITVGLVVACDMALIRMTGVNDRTLVAIASGTSAGMAFALLAIAVAVQMRFGAFIAPSSLVRALIAAAAGWSVAHALPSHSPLFALIALAAGGIAYVAALIATRELGAADLALLRKIARRA
jgi:stage V sporulation protein B